MDQRELRTVAVGLLVSLVLWNLPFGGVLLYPFKILATWLHELSHALIMVVTGVGVERVVIFRDTSGLAFPAGEANAVANAFIAAAGYMGTPLWGALLLAATPTARAARIAMLVLAALLLVSALTIVEAPPQDPWFGRWTVIVMAGVFAAAAVFVPGRWRLVTAHFIAVQSCVNALLDIRVLLRPSQMVGGRPTTASDAHNMAYATFGTHDAWAVWTWAAIWLLWSLAVLYVALRLSGSQAARIAAASAAPTELPRGESDRGARRRSPATAPGETAPSARADIGGP
ncbi:MAG: M50 family metallopeptidase [Deltaproteobacteria bacterium]|nr:M50 family metallopeptidase [Deltaproteobacteria bacterium]